MCDGFCVVLESVAGIGIGIVSGWFVVGCLLLFSFFEGLCGCLVIGSCKILVFP